MHRRILGIIVVAASLVVSVTGLRLAVRRSSPQARGRKSCPRVLGDDPCGPGSCTIFAVRRGDKVFFGNNEDSSDPRRSTGSSLRGRGYGSIYVGFNRYNPQGGINEKGLAFDYNALPKSPMKSHRELPRRPGPLANLIMQPAATVEEAMAILRWYDWRGTLAWQMLLADATGDAVVVSTGLDGELASTRKSPGDSFLVSTNGGNH